jgi:vacuolar protein sorting-associated protein 45
MQRFVENYPEFRSRSGQVSKHVTLLSELNRMIDKRRLMTASMHEQELACSSNMTSHHTEVMTLLNDPSIDENNKLRLVMLFALRYEQVSAPSSSIPHTLPGHGYPMCPRNSVRVRKFFLPMLKQRESQPMRESTREDGAVRVWSIC